MPFWEAQAHLSLIQWSLRAVVMFLFLLILVKLMGQREVSKFGLIDFIVGVIMGSAVAGTLDNSDTDLKGPMIAIATLAGLQILISIIGLKSLHIKRVLEEEPIILVQNGMLLESTLEKTRINLDDLLSQLRQKGFFYLEQVEFAVLEPNGSISVLPKSQDRFVTPKDLKIDTAYEGYPAVIIQDGKVRTKNLKKIGLTETWLQEQLKINNVSSPKEVLVATLDTQGKLFFSLKNTASERLRSRP